MSDGLIFFKNHLYCGRFTAFLGSRPPQLSCMGGEDESALRAFKRFSEEIDLNHKFGNAYAEEEFCWVDCISLHVFDEELHRIVFTVTGCSVYVVCFDFEEKKTVSVYHCLKQRPDYWVPLTVLEVDPTIPPAQVAKSWMKLEKAPYRYEKKLQRHQRYFGEEAGCSSSFLN
ncbi:hypothetical protein H6P81_000190 [Aristolochia fimbriata]|uniref:Uncharacterized protein n=1 Tax=Aristolochia fimbriata TaxID=158543 RepID=A0AAV7F6R3_ARIFI|nr:hypothetical protein H6P81_000190 [Aristolochia fimbriata]